MRAVIQRVSEANVSVEREGYHASIGRGLAVLIGVAVDDSEEDCSYMARKICGLRIFEDDGGKMNLSLADTGGAVLLVSQFTLCGDCRQGRRPSLTGAAPPDVAGVLYERVGELIREKGITTRSGLFGRHMLVRTVNDGPVTLLLDSGKAF